MKDKILAVKKFHETFKIGYLNSPEADLGIEKNTLINFFCWSNKLC